MLTILLLLPLFTSDPVPLYIVGLQLLDGNTGKRFVQNTILEIGVNSEADEYS
jgi:hypothetical protein